MNIKFKNSEKQLNELRISDIKLSSENPRYTTLESLEINLIDKIRNSTKNKYNQNDVKNILLSYEGDFSDLNNLFKSINEVGFNTKAEPIILIKDSLLNDSNKYIVAEGNRRMMCLKMIYNEFDFTDINSINNINNQENLSSDEDSKIDNYENRRKENHKNIIKLIKKIQEKNEDIIANINIVENDDELWSMIYTKHIAGERPGMRKWTRGKYFTDILSYFKDGIELKDLELFKKIRYKLQREPNIIIDDFKHAQFVKEILRRSKKNITDEEIYKKMKKMKVTALQSNFSLKRIKDSAKYLFDMDNKKFEENFLKFSYNEKNLLFFEVNKKLDTIFRFIYSNFEKGIITTRPVIQKNKNLFNMEVKNIFTNDLLHKDVNEFIKNSNSLDEINSFDCTIKKLDEIIDKWEEKKLDKNKIERFKITKKIKENEEEFKEYTKNNLNKNGNIVSYKEPKDVFYILIKQYYHNNESKLFFNAMGSSLRAMLEQIFIWGYYYYADDNQKQNHLKEMSNWNINKLSSNIRDRISSQKNDNESIKMIKKILEKIIKSQKNSEIEFIHKNWEKMTIFLNGTIHASHRMFFNEEYDKSLKKFRFCQENIMNIIKDIDFEKLKELNDKIKEKITNSNMWK